MGNIHHDVLANHLRVHPDERPLLDTFLHDFDVNFARVIQTPSFMTVYLLKPNKYMEAQFGFNNDILLCISRHHAVQHRTMQTIEKAFQIDRIKGRADPLTFILLSSDPDIHDWTSTYLAEHKPGRTPITLTIEDCETYGSDRWFLRNLLSRQLYQTDFFDDELPINTDTMFFGRSTLVDEHINAIKKLTNRGIFGLRKTGKTSVLFKIKRICDKNRIAHVAYLDCKRPDIRQMPWQQLITHITKQLASSANIEVPAGEPVAALIALLKSPHTEKPFCIMLDEIEYVSPLAQLDKHWHSDFIPFWQTLWSVQSEYRRLCCIVAGVNPYLSEIDTINRVQNPMFGIVKTSFVKGLNEREVSTMASRLGSRMGLQFDKTATEYLHKRFGGHPLLTRMACSHINRNLNIDRPASITAQYLRVSEDEREAELQFYCRHIVSELREFYHDEYFLLETLSSGEIVDFIQLASAPEWIQHLKSYGVIRVEKNRKPSFEIPVLQRYVALERARRDKQATQRYFIPREKRADWLSRRTKELLATLKKLQETFHRNKTWLPYGSRYLPEADRLSNIPLATNWLEFGAFCTSLNICLVEPIEEQHGRGAFFNQLKQSYPDLFDALHRIRVFRNNADHLRLNQPTQSVLDGYLQKDLYGAKLDTVPEPWFALQQIIIEELCAAAIYEIENYA